MVRQAMKKNRLRLILLAALAVVLAAALAFVLLSGWPVRDVTFFLTSDTHYGLSPSVGEANAKTV
jgi:flagellar basal body-associated protein FliL